MEKEFDYLIVGAGLFGSVFAHEAQKRGKRCLVIEKRSHIGGNIYTECVDGINVHKYGPHIFHTGNKQIWNYVNSFIEFKQFTYSPIAYYKGQLYNLPFNMNTFYQLWGVKTPIEAQQKIEEQRRKYVNIEPKNLEEQALFLVGEDIYEKLIMGYTEKQWGCKATALPAFIIKRLPVRYTFDNNYFNDPYQGIPIGGYTSLITKMLQDIEVRLNTDFFENRIHFEKMATKLVYTGSIDQFYNYQFGNLEYRSLHFEHSNLGIPNYQGNAVVNYTEFDIPYTRIIEHKHFEFGDQDNTIITKEYPDNWTLGKEAYYPINNQDNQTMFEKYNTLAKQETNIIFGGRLAEYKYYDMHHVIKSALNFF